MSQETDDDEFDHDEFDDHDKDDGSDGSGSDDNEFDDNASDNNEYDDNEYDDNSDYYRITDMYHDVIRSSIYEMVDGSFEEFSLDYAEDGTISPSVVQWTCFQLRTHVDTIRTTRLNVCVNWLETDEMVKDMTEFIRKSPTLSDVELDGNESDRTEILLLAAAENEGIKKVTVGDIHSGIPEAVIAILKAGHVESLNLECTHSHRWGITEDQYETAADALLMSPKLSYVSFQHGLFATCVLEKLSHGGKTRMKSLTVNVIIRGSHCFQMIDSLVNCVTSPRANVQTLHLRTDYLRGPGQSEVILPDMDFRIEPDNMGSKTIIHLACDIRDQYREHPIDWINFIDLLGVDARDDNWLGTVMSMPELQHLKLYSPNNLHDTDIDSLASAVSLRSIGFSFMEDFTIDLSRVYPAIGYLVARGSLKQAMFGSRQAFRALHIDCQGWANLSEFIISSAPSLKIVNLNVSIHQREGALQDRSNADRLPASTEKIPRALQNPSWNMLEVLLAEFLWSLRSLGPQVFSCIIVFSDEGSVQSISCDADFDESAWQCFCKMLADSSCAIERVEFSRLQACTWDPLWAALDSNSSLKYCNLNNQKRDWNDMIMYYTTRNKLDDLFSGDEITTMKLWVPAVEAVRNQYHGKSLIFHLVQAKPLLFVREGG